MNARVTTAHVRPDKMEEAISIVRESIAPVVGEQRGSRGLLLPTDPDACKGLAITLWESEEDMRSGKVTSYVQEQYGKLANVLAKPPAPEHFEIHVQDMKA